MPDRFHEWVAAVAAGGGVLAYLFLPLVKLLRVEASVADVKDRIAVLEVNDSVCEDTRVIVARIDQKLEDHVNEEKGVLQEILAEVRKI